MDEAKVIAGKLTEAQRRASDARRAAPCRMGTEARIEAMTVTRTLELTDITPQELAELFTNMDDHQQADFFAAIKPISDEWRGAGWCMQSCSINQQLNDDGRFVLETLASHLPSETLSRLAKATGDDHD